MPLALFAALALAGVRTNIRVNPNLPTHATADFDDQPFRVAHYRHGIVFDAGSSGSRIHVYTYKEGGRPPRTQFDLVKDDLVKISPGLSSFKDDPAAAGASLQPLIDHAKKVVPASRHYRVPVFLMATAGLRMVGEKAKDEILDSVRATLARSGFVFRDEWVTVLDGRDEGIYGWATVNYLKHTLYPKQGEASGVIDLGGGSVQIVFPMKRKRVAPLGYQRQLNYAGREHNLYVKSHLGYGLDAARDTLYERLIEAAAISATPGEVRPLHASVAAAMPGPPRYCTPCLRLACALPAPLTALRHRVRGCVRHRRSMKTYLMHHTDVLMTRTIHQPIDPTETDAPRVPNDPPPAQPCNLLFDVSAISHRSPRSCTKCASALLLLA